MPLSCLIDSWPCPSLRNLPGKPNAIDILEALTTITRRIKAILITGRGSEEIKSKANSLGALYGKNSPAARARNRPRGARRTLAIPLRLATARAFDSRQLHNV